MIQTFDSEEKCIEHLANLRWPDGPVCPSCGGFKQISYLKTQLRWRCGNCKKKFSVRIGTIFEKSRLPLRKWFMAISLLASNTKGISSHQLARDIGVTTKTACRLREAMPMLNSDLLIDDTYIGGKESNNHKNKRTAGTQGRGSNKHHVPMDFDQALKATIRPEMPQTFINLMIGDCLTLLEDMDSECVHLVATDPPYYLDGLDQDWRKGTGTTPRGTGSVGGLPVGMKFDPKQGRELQAFIESVGTAMLRVLVPGAFAVVFSQPRLVHRMAVGLEDAGFEIRDLYAWHYTQRAQFKAFSMNHFVDRMNLAHTEKTQLKRHLNGRKTPQLRPQFEAMVLAQKPRQGTFVENWLKYKTGLINSSATLDGKAPSTVMTVEKPLRNAGNNHLTVKPVQLMEHLIRLFSIPGQVVLDPFVGSGTTAVAARRIDRACIGMDINPDYIAIAEQRLQEAIQ